MLRLEDCLFVLIFLIVIAQAKIVDNETSVEEQKILATRRQLECIDEVRVPPQLVSAVRSGQWNDKNELLKKWALCVLIKAGLMTKEGVYLMDGPLQRTHPDHRQLLEHIIDLCLSQEPIPAPEIAYNFAKCFRRVGRGNFAYANIF